MRPSRAALAMLLLALAFLVGPFVVVFIAGFSGDETLAFPPKTWSWRWLLHVFTVDSFQRSFTACPISAVNSAISATSASITGG